MADTQRQSHESRCDRSALHCRDNGALFRRCAAIILTIETLLHSGCTAPSPVAEADNSTALHIGGATIDEDLPADLPNVSRADLAHWIENAAAAVTHFYGRYPVKYARIEVAAADRGRITGGVAFGGRLIRIQVGKRTRPSDLDRDWMLTHEMFHLGFPEVDEDFHYMEEGLSDYLEPLARARVGQLSDKKVWADFAEGMPQGQPQEGDQGLDRTHTWGRTYWGGAIFWLVADVRIREQTHNRKSLDDAIRAILDAGGDGSRHWPITQVIEVADRATGTDVLKRLHEELGTKPTRVDLDDLWKRLGVVRSGSTVTFDDTAPLADLRRSMTAVKSKK